MFYVICELHCPPTLAVKRYAPDFEGLSLTECNFSEGEDDKSLWLRSKHRKWAGVISRQDLLSLADDWELLPDDAQEMMGILCEYGTLPGMNVPGGIYEDYYLDYPQYYDESLSSGPWGLNPGRSPSLDVSIGPVDKTTWQEVLDVIEEMR